MDQIRTQSVARGVANASPLIITETSKTRTVFEPRIHGDGVRGILIRQNKNQEGIWSGTSEIDFRSAAPDTTVSIPLKTDGLRHLYDFLTELYALQSNGVERGQHDYVVAKKEEIVITNENLSRVIQELIDQNHSEEFWDTLAKHQKNLALRLAESQIQREQINVINQFEKDMVAYGTNEGHWQKFFEEHPWILQSAFSFTTFQLQGETYLGGKNSKGRNGQGCVATDFLFQDESTQSFAVIDIKTPKTVLMANSTYRGENGTQNTNLVFPASTDLSGGVIQVRNQIAVAIQNFNHSLREDYPELNRIHPHGVLVIGTYNSLTDEQKKSFNYFRQGLFGLTVITFDELLRRLKQLYCFDEMDSSTIETTSTDSKNDDPWQTWQNH